MWPTKRVGATMWFRRRADEAPLPRAAGGRRARGVHREPPPRRADEAPLPRVAEGRRARGIHRAVADVAPLSNAGAFFSKNVRWWRVQQISEKFELSFNFLCRRQVLTNTYSEGE